MPVETRSKKRGSKPGTEKGADNEKRGWWKGKRSNTGKKESPKRLKDVESWTDTVTCPICMLFLKRPIELKPCSHVFCNSCISKWLLRKKTCPCCRTPPVVLQADGAINAVLKQFQSCSSRSLRESLDCDRENLSFELITNRMTITEFVEKSESVMQQYCQQTYGSSQSSFASFMSPESPLSRATNEFIRTELFGALRQSVASPLPVGMLAFLGQSQNTGRRNEFVSVSPRRRRNAYRDDWNPPLSPRSLVFDDDDMNDAQIDEHVAGSRRMTRSGEGELMEGLTDTDTVESVTNNSHLDPYHRPVVPDVNERVSSMVNIDGVLVGPNDVPEVPMIFFGGPMPPPASNAGFDTQIVLGRIRNNQHSDR